MQADQVMNEVLVLVGLVMTLADDVVAPILFGRLSNQELCLSMQPEQKPMSLLLRKKRTPEWIRFWRCFSVTRNVSVGHLHNITPVAAAEAGVQVVVR